MAQDPAVKLKISGQRNVEGELSTKGSIEFRIADASDASFHFDYREDDRLVLGIRSTAGFDLGGTAELTLSGGVQHDLADGEWVGDVKAEIEFSKDVRAVIEQKFAPKGPTTSVALTVAF